MRQSINGTTSAVRKRSFRWRQPTRHAWRIRRRTINNHSKTDMFNRVFVYGWFIVCQGGIAPTTLRHFAKPSGGKPENLNRTKILDKIKLFVFNNYC